MIRVFHVQRWGVSEATGRREHALRAVQWALLFVVTLTHNGHQGKVTRTKSGRPHPGVSAEERSCV